MGSGDPDDDGGASADNQLRVAERLEALGTLAGGLAHDLNNILTVILTTSAMLRGRLPDDDRAVRDVKLIEEAAARGSTLARRLLTFGRPHARCPSSVDVSAVVAGSRALLQRLAGTAVEVRCDPCLDDTSALADPVQLEQLLLNLVMNAVDAMPRGGTITIATRAVRLDEGQAGDLGLAPGPYVELTVTDTGHGMGPEIVERLWEPFFTTKPETGTGLGLSAVRRIVVDHDGAVRVESEPNRGATFRIWLQGG